MFLGSRHRLGLAASRRARIHAVSVLAPRRSTGCMERSGRVLAVSAALVQGAVGNGAWG